MQFSRIGNSLESFLSPDERNLRLEALAERGAHIESTRFLVQQGGGPDKISYLHDKGFMTADERVLALIDSGSQFLPLLDFAGLDYLAVDGKKSPRAGVIGGLGTVHNKKVMVIANDNTVNLGAWVGPSTKKILSLEMMADNLGVPVVWLVDTVGLNLSEPYNAFSGPGGAGSLFGYQAHLLKHKIHQIAGVFGACIAGGGYMPIGADYKVMSKLAYLVIGGGGMLKYEGKELNPMQYGGAGIHVHLSGCVTERAPNDMAVIKKLRQNIEKLGNNVDWYRDVFRTTNSVHTPYFNPNEIGSVMPHSNKLGYDMYEVISRLVDNSLFWEFQPHYGESLICGIASISGLPVGILANNPNPITDPYSGEPRKGSTIYPHSANKAIDFAEKCSSNGIPMLYINDIFGFDFGVEAEKYALLAKGFEWIRQNVQSEIASINLDLRNICGAGHYAMNGKPTGGATIELATPYTDLRVMPPELSAMLTYMSDINKLKRDRVLEGDERWTQLNAKIAELTVKTIEESGILKRAAAMHIDEVISFENVYNYVRASVEAMYQSGRLAINPPSIWSFHTDRGKIH